MVGIRVTDSWWGALCRPWGAVAWTLGRPHRDPIKTPSLIFFLQLSKGHSCYRCFTEEETETPRGHTHSSRVPASPVALAWDSAAELSLNLATVPTTPYCLSNTQLFYLSLCLLYCFFLFFYYAEKQFYESVSIAKMGKQARARQPCGFSTPWRQ